MTVADSYCSQAGAIQCILSVLEFKPCNNSYEVGTILVSILWRRKLRKTEAKSFAKDHT